VAWKGLREEYEHRKLNVWKWSKPPTPTGFCDLILVPFCCDLKCRGRKGLDIEKGDVCF